MESLQNWLGNPGRQYLEGVKLYKQLRPNCQFVAFFSQQENPKPNSQHFQILTKRLSNILRVELQKPKKEQPEFPDTNNSKAIKVEELPQVKKADTERPAQSAADGSRSARPRIDDNPHIRVEELPQELQIVYNRNKAIAKERSAFHEKAKQATTDEDRKEAINEAAKLDDQLAANWEQIDTWYQNRGQEKTEEQLAEEKANTNRLKNLRSYITKGEKKLKGLEGDQKTKEEQKIKDWKAELKELEAWKKGQKA